MIPVQSPNFQTWNDINAFGQGFTGAQDMYAKNVQNQYLQPTLQQELLKAQYNNQLLGAQAQLAQPMAQAGLATAQAQAPLMNAQTQEALLGKIPQEQASANLSNVTAQYMPFDSLVKAQNTINSNQRFGWAYQLRNWLNQLPPATKAAWIAQNQQQYNDMGAALGNSQNTNYITPQIVGQYFPGLNARVPLTPQAQQQVAQQAQQQATAAMPGAAAAGMGNLGQYLSPKPGVPLSNQLNQAAQPQQPTAQVANNIAPGGFGFQSTPDITAITKNASMMAANKDLTTGTTNTRYQAAIAADNLLNSPSVAQGFNTLAKYSGIQGMTDAQAQRILSPQEWANYSSARDQMSSILSGSIKQLESMPTSNAGLENAKNYFQQAQQALMKNAPAYMSYVNQGRQYLDAEAKALQTAANPVFNVNRLPSPVTYPGTPAPQAQATSSTAPANTVQMSYQGKIWHVPVDKVGIMKKNGGQIIG